MATYEYTARDSSGREFCGTYRDISGAGALRAELERIGCVLLRARRARKASQRQTRIRNKDVVAFAYKFAGMYAAGLSVIDCLETLETQTENRSFRTLIASIRGRIQVGSSLAQAFEPHREVFSEFFVGMLEAGEAGGKLAESLEMSAAYLENKAKLQNKIQSALVYPIAVGVVCLAVLVCLLLFVVPVFSKLYGNMHVPLPWPTLILVGISEGLRHWLWVILPAGAGIIWLLKRTLQGPRLRNRWDHMKLRMPLTGKLSRLILVARFVRPFAMLMSVGVPVIEALRIGGRIARNERMTSVAKELQRAAQAGNPVGRALGTHSIFPPVIVQMAASGEQVGRLAEMLTKGVEILDRDIETMINSLVVKIEPALTLFTGLLIGLVLMGVYLPMFDYMTYLR